MTEARLVASDLTFAEGPRWREGRLWFSDMYDHAVKSLGDDGRVRIEVEIAGRPSGLGWLPDGRLLVVSMVDRTVMRLDGDRLVVHADLGSLAEFHCNDMVVDDVGRAYVGNFGFDLHEAERLDDFSSSRPASMVMIEPDGTARIVAGDLQFPNGTVITPDGATLIVAESMGRRLTAFDRAPDGGLSGRRVWAETGAAMPDGICLDTAGAIWFANPFAPECIRIAEGGEVLDVIETDAPTFACMLGGLARRTLYILCAPPAPPDQLAADRNGTIVAIDVATPAAGFP